MSRRRLLLGLGAAALVGAGAVTCAGDRHRWTVSGRGGDLGLAAGDGLVFAAGSDSRSRAAAIDVRTGETRWTYDLEIPEHGPVTVDDLVVIGDRYGIHALDAATGARRWMQEEAMLVAAGDGMVLCWRRGATLQEPSTFMAVDAATGDARWAIPLRAPGGRPARIAAGRVHLGPGRAPLRTLDAVTGAVLWEQPVQNAVGMAVAGPIVACAEEPSRERLSLEEIGKFSPASHVGFEAASGRQLWRRPQENAWLPGSRPGLLTAWGDRLIVSGADSDVAAWNAATGETLWEAESLGLHHLTLTAPVVAGGTCYVAGYSVDGSGGGTVVEHNGVRTVVERDVDLEHLIVALAADTGKRLWSVATGPGYTTSASALESIGRQFRSQLTVVDDTVVFGSRGGVAGFAA